MIVTLLVPKSTLDSLRERIAAYRKMEVNSIGFSTLYFATMPQDGELVYFSVTVETPDDIYFQTLVGKIERIAHNPTIEKPASPVISLYAEMREISLCETLNPFVIIG